MEIEALTSPTVRDMLAAAKGGDKAAFLSHFAPDAQVTDDGKSWDASAWIDQNVFAIHGWFEPVEQDADGLNLLAQFHSDTWNMPIYLNFGLDGDKVRRLDTGQRET